MIDKRLFQLTEKKNLVKIVILRVLQLIVSIFMWGVIAKQLSRFTQTNTLSSSVLIYSFLFVIAIKIVIGKWLEKLTYAASSELRLSMRHRVIKKAFRLGKGQGQLAPTTLTQLSVDGIEQLEIYYARFLPQLFYCLLASVCIFSTLVYYSWLPAVILFLCMPLIPLIIVAVMKMAKRILGNYWTQYTDLGVKFHENLSGLSTLKAFDQDGIKQMEAAKDAERFRKVTMSLLSMQLNSITVMDIISYCGAGLGIGVSLFFYVNQQLSLTGMLLFILLSAEFFIPMRQLGSLFHVAMNGISACKKLFSYLELPEQVYGEFSLEKRLNSIRMENLTYCYNEVENPVLENISLEIKKGTFTALVGKSGSGKSTAAKLLIHQLSEYKGTITWNQNDLKELTKKSIQDKTVLVDSHGFVYPTTIKENLLLGNKESSDKELWEVLEKVQLTQLVYHLPDQLMTQLDEDGQNLSGGQRQRLLLARALLKKADCYIFDEVTSGVDLKSEEIILECLQQLAKTTIVLFISHRLYNVLKADQVIIFDSGRIITSGIPEALRKESDYFKNYFDQEQKLIDGGMNA